MTQSFLSQKPFLKGFITHASLFFRLILCGIMCFLLVFRQDGLKMEIYELRWLFLSICKVFHKATRGDNTAACFMHHFAQQIAVSKIELFKTSKMAPVLARKATQAKLSHE